jgi:spore maturation protein CgeB
MKPAREWLSELQAVSLPPDLEETGGREGEPTLRAGAVYLHSRYRPREEAARLVDAAQLDAGRPVLVLGLGLGYHVLELQRRGFAVAVVEPNPAVARLAVQGPMRESSVLLGIGDAAAVAEEPGFIEFAEDLPQVLVHPPTARLHPGWAEAMAAALARTALRRQRLSVAVVGPMYGGSLPVAQYLARALERLGHRTLFVDNSQGWQLYDVATRTVKTRKAAEQLGSLLVNFLGEWSYARVAEFAPDVCIVVAQAPVGKPFATRLSQAGIATAFWFVENGRHLGYWRDVAPVYDYFFHIQPGPFEAQLDAAGCRRHAYLPTGCDPEIHRPVELTPQEREEYGCDLSFAGAGYFNRVQTFLGLTDYDFKIWGVNWDARELQPLLQRAEERFTPEEFAKIVAGSKINLNLHSSTEHAGVDPGADAINPRVFEVAACGGFQLCDPCRGLEDFFDPDTEVPTYRNLTELRARIDYFLAHPEEREAMARRARERALREHTYEQRARQMLERILDACGPRILRKGIRVQRTVAEVAERVGRDTPLGQYLCSLPADLPFTQETLAERIGPPIGERGYVEAVFTYLEEVRRSTEALLAVAER